MLGRIWIITALISATAVAIGVGVGVGTWHRRSHSPHVSSSISNYTPISNNTRPILNHTSQVTLGPTLNDTSFAALAADNGDRYLFFQDHTGLIRQAIRTQSDGQWITREDFNVSSNAKSHTPLAAIFDGNYNTVLKRKPLNV